MIMRIKAKLKKLIINLKIFFLEISCLKNKERILNLKSIQSKKVDFLDFDFKQTRFINLKLDKNYRKSLKWVGAVNYNDFIYFIPNSFNKILKFNTYDFNYEFIDIKDYNGENFEWTGGCLYKEKIYGFPRRSNKLLCINPKNDNVNLIDLNIDYDREHHYGGVLTTDGIIYQPPRKNNTILMINLNNNTSSEIKICSNKIKLSYISGKLHPNGLIYFLPEISEKVLVFNPKTKKFWFIGKRLNSMVFDVAIAPNGNMYGFSGYCKGILKIDPFKNKTEMICKDIGCPGSFGSKLTFNGKIYSIPGNGNHIYEFDPQTETIKIIYSFDKSDNTKYASGSLTDNGNIICSPEMSCEILILEFGNLQQKKFDINNYPFIDNY